ncbi:MAG: hypothetical protein ACREIA_01560 [Opitutaceae bacterium]
MFGLAGLLGGGGGGGFSNSTSSTATGGVQDTAQSNAFVVTGGGKGISNQTMMIVGVAAAVAMALIFARRK